jgi:hypothetical protein
MTDFFFCPPSTILIHILAGQFRIASDGIVPAPELRSSYFFGLRAPEGKVSQPGGSQPEVTLPQLSAIKCQVFFCRAARVSSSVAPVSVFGWPVTVTSTRAPFLSFTSSPCSSIKAFSMRSSRYRRSAPPTTICAFSGLLGPGDATIFLTVPGIVVLGCSRMRVGSRFSSVILADRAMRGFTISSATAACVARWSSFLAFLFSMALF